MNATHEGLEPHLRWMIRRDMEEVLVIDGRLERTRGEEWFLRQLRERNVIGMIADVDDKVVGFFVYGLYPTKLKILHAGVEPAYRRRGVGTAMFEKLKNKLSNHRRDGVYANVPETNLGMLLCLKSVGFRAEKVLHGPVGDRYQMVYRIPRDGVGEGL